MTRYGGASSHAPAVTPGPVHPPAGPGNLNAKPERCKMQVFLPILAILFIGLKLTGYIAWSWLWVLSPLWLGFVVSALIFLVGMLIFWKAGWF